MTAKEELNQILTSRPDLLETAIALLTELLQDPASPAAAGQTAR